MGEGGADAGLSVEDFGDHDEAVGLVRGVGEGGFFVEAFFGLVGAEDVVDGVGVGSGVDAGDVELGELVDVFENLAELTFKLGFFFRREVDAGEVGDVVDVEFGFHQIKIKRKRS